MLTDRERKRLVPWVTCGLLLAAMRREGIRRLCESRTVTVAEFAVAFPDSCKLLSVMPSRELTLEGPFADLCTELEYAGHPEFLTFWACLLLTRSSRLLPEWHETNRRSLLRWQARGIDIVPA